MDVARPAALLLTALPMMVPLANFPQPLTQSAEMTVFVLTPSNVIPLLLLGITMVARRMDKVTTVWEINLARPALLTLTALTMEVSNPTNLCVMSHLEPALTVPPTVTVPQETVMRMDAAKPALSSLEEQLARTLMVPLEPATSTPTVTLSPPFAWTSVLLMTNVRIPVLLAAILREVAVLSVPLILTALFPSGEVPKSSTLSALAIPCVFFL